MPHAASPATESAESRARAYEERAQSLYKQIEDLTGDDPEDADAARTWAAEARYAQQRADSIRRWASR